MTTDLEIIHTYFSKLSLEKEIADIYYSLYSQGPQNISELARSSKVERTRIYRLIDQLLQSNLIEMESIGTRGIIKAAPVSNLRILIEQKEHELKSLHEELDLIEQIFTHNTLSSPVANVRFYAGSIGMRKMLSNQTASKTNILLLIQKPMLVGVDAYFRKQWIESCEKQSLSFRTISNNNVTLPLKQKEDRHIPVTVFPIDHTTIIYDDVICYILYKGVDVFGIELRNPIIAKAQRYLFNELWIKSAPFQE